MHLNIEKLKSELGDDYFLLLRLHPHVADKFSLSDKNQDFVYNFSDYPDLNGLLLVSDILITDYSSIFYEYSLLDKPMIFYPYDLELYQKHVRGFYFDYVKFVPGPVVFNTEGIINVLKTGDFPMDSIDRFKKKSFTFYDGKSTERVINIVFN